VKESASRINDALASFTDVVELAISQSSANGYDLTLVLANSDRASAKLECSDVSNFTIAEFGGGLTQFLCLRAEDVSGAQLDRVALRFVDLERGSIAFDCSSATVTSSQIP
jgi:hypothetical protein